jgi:hypothetical protein
MPRNLHARRTHCDMDHRPRTLQVILRLLLCCDRRPRLRESSEGIRIMLSSFHRSERLVDELSTRLRVDGYYESVVIDPNGNRMELCS